nr:immunoglobulin heavy chain junction region [Macaca mulatta]MOW77172.1 immunoglobulin heavy chain junction region [Macaca mulatta]MOW81600.1 immunoglobulin heavy chain junction region [Macaca mulatta]MOW83409.1 immunoglobulin heavy chain junction region [Macaca mulatta]MOW85453.1 immunoglobulin heavy chain junction region [Macaca mulatta]
CARGALGQLIPRGFDYW